jgi:hypothetical protein
MSSFVESAYNLYKETKRQISILYDKSMYECFFLRERFARCTDHTFEQCLYMNNFNLMNKYFFNIIYINEGSFSYFASLATDVRAKICSSSKKVTIF